MRDSRLNLFIFAACGVVAVGTFGPWIIIGSETYGLTDGYGFIALASAGLVGIAVWRWASGGRSVILLGALVAAVVGTAVSAFDFVDVTLLADDEGFRAGWGMKVALSSLVVLVVLCSIQCGRSRRLRQQAVVGTIGMLVVILVGMAAISVVWMAQGRESKPVIWMSDGVERVVPLQAARVGSGEARGTKWNVWLFGNAQGDVCTGTGTYKKQVDWESEGVFGDTVQSTCGSKVPSQYWQQVAEVVPPGGHKDMKVFFVTRRDVGYLDVWTGGNAGEFGRTRARVRVIPARRARRALLPGDIGYAIADIARSACIRKVITFDHAGRRMQGTPLATCN